MLGARRGRSTGWASAADLDPRPDPHVATRTGATSGGSATANVEPAHWGCHTGSFMSKYLHVVSSPRVNPEPVVERELVGPAGQVARSPPDPQLCSWQAPQDQGRRAPQSARWDTWSLGLTLKKQRRLWRPGAARRAESDGSRRAQRSPRQASPEAFLSWEGPKPGRRLCQHKGVHREAGPQALVTPHQRLCPWQNHLTADPRWGPPASLGAGLATKMPGRAGAPRAQGRPWPREKQTWGHSKQQACPPVQHPGPLPTDGMPQTPHPGKDRSGRPGGLKPRNPGRLWRRTPGRPGRFLTSSQCSQPPPRFAVIRKAGPGSLPGCSAVFIRLTLGILGLTQGLSASARDTSQLLPVSQTAELGGWGAGARVQSSLWA